LNYYSGLSGLELPIPKYKFPEEHRDSSRLTYYATFFNSIEINGSFYKLPLQKTLLKWTSMVPASFKFTFKLWQEITHAKDLAFKEEDVSAFIKAISVIGERKGCILIQFPPSLGVSAIPELDALLGYLRRVDDSWPLAVEFRNRSWHDARVYDILEKNEATVVVHDIPKSRTPFVDHRSAVIYLRFHGPTGNYRDSYSESFLAEYATYIKEWLAENKTVYVYFNNTMGDAFKNLQTLNNFVIGDL
jgi:uncharacterized protein YecE (DUF72 family)